MYFEKRQNKHANTQKILFGVSLHQKEKYVFSNIYNLEEKCLQRLESLAMALVCQGMVQVSIKTWTSVSSSSTVITAGLLSFSTCFYSYLYFQISFSPTSNWKTIPPRYIVRECFLKIFGFDKLAFSRRKAFSETACQNLIKTCVLRDK